MKFFDLHVHSAFSQGFSTLEEIATTAKRLGYAGICFSAYFKNKQQIEEIYKQLEETREKVGIDILLGFEARNIREMNLLSKIRKSFDILLARGGDLKMNRAAVETAQVDILTHPSLGRNDAGINHVHAKLARKNNVAFEINFHEVVSESKIERARILNNLRNLVRIARKYKANVLICSGALTHWEMKDPFVLYSFGTQLGMEIGEVKDAISKIPERIVREAKERRKKEWIIPGVKVVR